jgi:hypothetical protein
MPDYRGDADQAALKTPKKPAPGGSRVKRGKKAGPK